MSKFSEIITAEVPVLVDFYADWCGPCQMMAPILKQVKDELGDQVKIVKINVDKNPALASQYGVQGIPTFLFFKQGVLKHRQSGAMQKLAIINEIKKL